MQKITMFVVMLFVLMVSPLAICYAGTIEVPKTGQGSCYDASGALLTSCTGTGQDAEFQSGAASPTPRFIVETGGGTVADNLTGLIWAKDANLIKTVHTAVSVTVPVTPFETDGISDDGRISWQAALDYIKYLNTNSYLGYKDWRLPTRNELESLINRAQGSSADWLNTQGFSNVNNNYYWTSSNFYNYPENAWSVDMNVGGATYYSKGYDLYVWPVRTGRVASLPFLTVSKTEQTSCFDTAGGGVSCTNTLQDGDSQAGAAWPTSRFIDNGGISVTDNLTGLIWSKSGNSPGPAVCTPGVKKDWQGALDHIKCLNANSYLGKTTWRLPNVNELATLVHKGQANSALWLNAAAQKFLDVQEGDYWSSTTVVGYLGYAWAVNMTDGDLYFNYKTNKVSYVLPVLSGQSALLLSKSGTGSGTVETSPVAILCDPTCSASSEIFPLDTSVTLTATAASGSVFAGWSGACSGTDLTCTVTMNETKNVTAAFNAAFEMNVSKSGTGGGTVISTPAGLSCGATCTSLLPGGATVTLTAAADIGSIFAGWSGALCSGGSTTAAKNVNGLVVDLSTENPITGAIVSAFLQLSNPDSAATSSVPPVGTATTDANGNYTMPGLTAGTEYYFKISKPDYVDFYYFSIVPNVDSDLSLEKVRLTPLAMAAQTATASGKVKNASTNEGLPNMRVDIRSGVNNKSGTAVGTAVTDATGAYSFAALPAGTYTAEVTGNIGSTAIITSYFTLVSIPASLASSNQDFPVTTPLISSSGTGQYRIVLNWGDNPRDLDSHLTGPIPNATDRFHTSWNSRDYPISSTTTDISGFRLAGADTEVFLDIDNVIHGTNNGPETTTIVVPGTGVYNFFVHHFSGSSTISLSGAQVKVYKGSALIGTFNPPTGAVGQDDVWGVFSMNVASSGETITPVNQMFVNAGTANIDTLVPTTGIGTGGSTGTGSTGGTGDATLITTTTTGTCTLTMDEVKNVFAVFTGVQNLKVIKTGNGTVTANPALLSCGTVCTASVNTGSTVTLTATPTDANSVFLGWGGVCSGTVATCTVTMDAAKEVTALFGDAYTATVTKTGTGSGTVTAPTLSCGSTCSGSFESGTSVEFTATADAGSAFIGWSGACSGTDLICTVTMDAGKNVTATFSQVVAATVTKTGNGTGTVTSNYSSISCGSTCSAFILTGTAVTFTATPDANNLFAGWGGVCSGTSTTCTVTMNIAKDVTATFISAYNANITKSGTGNGTVTSNLSSLQCGTSCSALIEKDKTVTLTATADTNYSFSSWSGACSGTSPTCTIKMDAAKSVNAEFVNSGVCGIANGKAFVLSPPVDNLCLIGSSTTVNKKADLFLWEWTCPSAVTGGITVNCNARVSETKDMNNGTVYVTGTELVWLKNANCFAGQFWDIANAKAAALKSGDCGLIDGSKAGDWRLPTKIEFEKFLDAGYRTANLNAPIGAFTDVQPEYYWSSDILNNLSSYAGHTDGGVQVWENNYAFYVWPVRGVKAPPVITWRNQIDGRDYNMTTDGSSVTGGGLFYQEADTAWVIVGKGDFDADGIKDLVWWNKTSGQVYIMLMADALAIKSGAVIYTEANTAWRIVATGDINGDGKTDLLWWNNATGQVYAMLINGASTTGGSIIYTEANTEWKIVAFADFNGNGKADLLWWNSTTGNVAVGQTNDTAESTAAIIYTESNTEWRIAGAGDLDGDGKADIIWHNRSTGQVYGMQTNGSAVTGGEMIYTEPDTNWEIVTIGNYNSDNRADLLWWNQSTGQVYLMPMNGLSVLEGALLYTEPDTNWRIQGETGWRDDMYGKGVTTTTK